VAEELNRNLETLTMQDLGTASRVLITKDSTIISGGAGNKEDIENRKNEIKTLLENVTSEYDREKLQERLSKLSGGVGSIRVGAGSESELKERKDSVEDALHATRAAIEEGIVPGGGLALIRCGQAVQESLLFPNEDQNQGAELVFKVLKVPFMQILENAGLEPRSILTEVLSGSGDFGYNSATESYANLVADGVVDPKKVVRIALENAASVAGTILTTEATITDVRNEMYYKLRMPATEM
jgi:chaperonin GroEL